MVSELWRQHLNKVISIFNGDAYVFWRIKMKTILKTRKLWVVVENGVLVVVSTDVNTPAMTKNQEDLVMKDIKAQEKRLSIREERINEDAFYGGKLGSKGGNKQGNKRHEKTKRWCGVCKRDNHNEVDCWRRKNGGVPQMSAKNERKCYVCDKPGHIAKDCRLRKTKRADLSLEETDEEVVNEGHILFIAVEEESSSNVNDETWLVDSRCTNHMTKEVNYFITLDRSVTVPIKVGNGQNVMTAGKRNIQVMTSQGEQIIEEVFLVPELARNLLSVSQMVSRGYRVLFEDNRCLINNSQGRKILSIKMKIKSFPIRLSKPETNALLAHEEEVDKPKPLNLARFEDLRTRLGLKEKLN